MRNDWVSAVRALGGDGGVAADAAADLAARYAEPHRRYHDTAHVLAVLRDSAALAADLGLPPEERAVLALAAAAHDVVYDGRPGDDERRSAEWAVSWLRRAGARPEHVTRVEELVLATLTHAAPDGDATAQALLDADLAILGADEVAYDRYRSAVRAEYAPISDELWRAGRSAVLSDLLARDPLYATAAARSRWEAAAKANLARELAALRTR
ncbi:HD domain-containing protein [Amycolatopsis sp. ATCC 39116]|uniref:HD domain-containing protein n=1 Tax=Amycolatopsis sp. (strain ATCC 39116 / 75iv2) TaxID=385957 RepID=UPI0002628E16|nr:HD domain-containing protein [Amycolatopsis sp. ATCC 39116]